jgi:putative Ca2+/H+ antiporter (TMEM165/GDT1 family)
VSFTATVISFLVILPAELPDKTVLACLVMGSRHRPGFVFAGAAAAFAVQVALAITAGGLLGLLPRRPVQALLSVLFLAAAVLLWRQARRDAGGVLAGPEPGGRFVPVALTAFAVVFTAEFGDLTQIVTASLAVRYHDPLAVGIGSALALWVAAGAAIMSGKSLPRIIPLSWVTRGAALVMLALAGVSIAAVFVRAA